MYCHYVSTWFVLYCHNCDSQNLTFYLFFTPAEHLKRFFRSMRTVYGRLTNPKSGKGRTEFTERDQFIVTTWAFVEKHIRRALKTKSTAVVGLSLFTTSAMWGQWKFEIFRSTHDSIFPHCPIYCMMQILPFVMVSVVHKTIIDNIGLNKHNWKISWNTDKKLILRTSYLFETLNCSHMWRQSSAVGLILN